MASSSPDDPTGCAPDQSPTVLLLIDVINDMEFDGGEDLFEHALPAAKEIAALKERAVAAGVPVIYVNDNFGRWRSDFRAQVKHCLADGVRGRPIAELLHPGERDYFVLKPKHSGFFASSLEILLRYLGARTLILTGFAGDICVLYTANDAYMRDFELIVPSDCIASETDGANRHALSQMQRFLKTKTCPGAEIEITGRHASTP
ncbi:MAG: cysteine hydrolase family protein [Chthoniobacteraceae bacterium]